MRRALASLLCLLAFPAWAGNYLNEDTIPPTLLATPWEEGSAEWKRDVQEIVALQKNAKAVEIEKASAEMQMSPALITSALGFELTEATYPVTYALLVKVGEDAKAINNKAKDYWKTRRPYIGASGEVRALIKPHQNPSYPSSHTTGSLVWAEVLGQLLPDKREALRARMEEVAYHRVLVGMHYPVDIIGGRSMARMIIGALWQNEAFKKDFQAAKQELKGRR